MKNLELTKGNINQEIWEVPKRKKIENQKKLSIKIFGKLENHKNSKNGKAK